MLQSHLGFSLQNIMLLQLYRTFYHVIHDTASYLSYVI